MSLGRNLRVEPVRVLGYGSIDASYVEVGAPAGRADAVLQFQNLTDTTMMFSFDGVTDHFPLGAGGYFVLDICTNKVTGDGMYLSIGTQFYVRYLSAPSVGAVYISLYYGTN